MPILENDAWRQQYFASTQCPEDIVICTDDVCAVTQYPHLAWLYNKINLCKLQGIVCGTHQEEPLVYPVFSKPITNLRGMGIDSHLLSSKEDYQKYCKPGIFWMEYFQGEHISTDIVLLHGQVVWWGHVRGIGSDNGTFDYWHIEASNRDALEQKIQALLKPHLGEFTGLVNIESIGSNIIEIHLRLTDQWPDLYGKNWIDCVVGLYAHKKWLGPRRQEQQAYSVVLFGPHGIEYTKPSDSIINEIKKRKNVSSIQITFDDAISNKKHAMPPGGFRLAIINCFDLSVGRQACYELAHYFGITYKHV